MKTIHLQAIGQHPAKPAPKGLPAVRVRYSHPGGSCHNCGRDDTESPYILVQRRNDGRMGGSVDSEDQYCATCEPTIMERLQASHDAGEITLFDER